MHLLYLQLRKGVKNKMEQIFKSNKLVAKFVFNNICSNLYLKLKHRIAVEGIFKIWRKREKIENLQKKLE